MYEAICSFFEQSGDLVNILGMIGVVLLTLLISMAVAIFRDDKKDFDILDRNVILDHIVKARYFLLYLALVYIPLLLWKVSSCMFRAIELFIWFIGVYCMAKVLIAAYHWMKGDKFKFRFDYLRALNNPKDMEESWRSVWEAENINALNEEKFLTIFSSTIDDLLQNTTAEKIQIASKLLDDFNAFIDNRSMVPLVVSTDFFTRFLEWHFLVWERAYQLYGKDKTSERRNYKPLSRTLDSILEKIEERILKEGQSSSFFEDFETHIEKSVSNRLYAQSVIGVFYKTFAENIKNSPERADIWWRGYFPDAWKIKKENIQERGHVLCSLWDSFLDWASARILSSTNQSEFDGTLDDMARNLFPSVDPILWEKLFTLFVIRRRADNNRMKSLVELCLNFGFGDRVIMSDYVSDEQSSKELCEQTKSQRDDTMELAVFLSQCKCKHRFTKVELNGYISDLKAMIQYYEKSREEARIKDYIAVFEEMINLLDSE